MTPPIDDARTWLARGFAPIPIPHGRKGPVLDGWTELRIDEDTLREHFNGQPQNVGVLQGAHSDGRVCVDLDSPEAIALAPAFLPPTGLIHGRPGNPRSHWFYHVTGSLPATARLDDPLMRTMPQEQRGKARVVELLSTGTQVVVAGQHPSGENYRLDTDGPPATIEGDDLVERVYRLAAAALLARYWPPEGQRHDASLALAGGLLRGGWNVTEADHFIGAIAHAAGDEEAHSRARNVASTAQRLAGEGNVTGWPTLAQLIDPRIVEKVREWLGLTAVESSAAAPLLPPLADMIAYVPPLPESACLTPEMEAEAARTRALWLQPCVEAILALSPRTAPALAEACAYFALLLAIARRAYVRAGPKHFYPALFLIFVARSTLVAKTTALDALRRLLRDAGLGHLLLPSKFTPQALLADLALHVSSSVRDASPEAQRQWLERHQHGAQRGIIRDEVSGLFEDCTKDYNSGLLPLLLEMDGAPDQLDPDLTISRGLIEVERVGINLIGCTTPAALRDHAAKPYHWANGLFGRLPLITADTEPVYAFWPRQVESFPGGVVGHLRRVYDALPRPTAEFEFGEPSEKAKQAPIIGAKQVGYVARAVSVTDEAWEAWQRYDRGLHTLAARPEAPERLDPTYGRLPSAAIRLATGLAVCEWALLDPATRGTEPPTVAIGHWAAAQQTVERWRRDVHVVLAAALRAEAEEAAAKPVGRLAALLERHDGVMQRGVVERKLNWNAAQVTAAVAASGGRIVEWDAPTGGRPTKWLGFADKGTKGTKARPPNSAPRPDVNSVPPASGTLVVPEGTKVPGSSERAAGGEIETETRESVSSTASGGGANDFSAFSSNGDELGGAPLPEADGQDVTEWFE
jgi:hypothetical protein